MINLLGLILVSFFITSFLLVPFIDLLFHLKRKGQNSNKKIIDETTPIHNKILAGKDIDTPVGGGLLVIPVTVLLTLGVFYFGKINLDYQIYVLIFTLISFGLIGSLDDIRKIFVSFSGKYAGV